MLYNNQLRQTEALSSALRAAELYRDVGDDRGLTRALSQVGQQYAKLDDFERAIAAAEEALRIANSLGDSTLLAGVMARSAGSFGPSQIDCARKRYAESVNLFRELGRKDDEARVLCGWIGAEGLAGAFEEAAAVIERALPLAVGELRMWIFQFAMTTYWMLGDRKRADPATRETIRLAACVGHPTLLASAMSYAAIIASDSDVADAARLLGYADSRHEASGYIAEPEEGRILDGLRSELVDRLGSKTVEELFAQGRAWSDDHAITVASRV
jgi:tetratricopeptide (TPR) repeat protein